MSRYHSLSSNDNGLCRLPDELLLSVADYLTRLDDIVVLSQTCRRLRQCMQLVPSNALLRLAASPTNVDYRLSEEAVLGIVGHQLGSWARLSPTNEEILAAQAKDGVSGLVRLALEICGLTWTRLWHFHQQRIEFIEPLANIIDQCCGDQWYEPEYWDGGRFGADSVSISPAITVYHFIIYGELFGPDLEARISPNPSHHPLNLQTRLEVVKYCIPDSWIWYAIDDGSYLAADPRVSIEACGPYTLSGGTSCDNDNLALVWTLQSMHWKQFWRQLRADADVVEFANFAQDPTQHEDSNMWRQRLLESTMILVTLQNANNRLEQIRRWRTQIAAMQSPPEVIRIGEPYTCDYPYLLGDLQLIGWSQLSNRYDTEHAYLPPEIGF